MHTKTTAETEGSTTTSEVSLVEVLDGRDGSAVRAQEEKRTHPVIRTPQHWAQNTTNFYRQRIDEQQHNC